MPRGSGVQDGELNKLQFPARLSSYLAVSQAANDKIARKAS